MRKIVRRWFVNVNDIILEFTIDAKGILQVNLVSGLKTGEDINLKVYTHGSEYGKD